MDEECYTDGVVEQNGAIGGGFTEGELKFASFWVRHRLQIQRGVIIGFMALNVGLWGYVLWGMLDAYAISYPRESRFIQEIAQNQHTLEALETDRPTVVNSGNAFVLQGTDGRFDMGVDLENTNQQWWAEFTYRFNFSGEQTPQRSGFIMPSSRTTLTELGFRPKGKGGATAQFVVDTITWHRVDPAQVGARYTDYQLKHFNVAFENITFQNDVTLGAQQLSRSAFDLVNRGAYGYWGMDVVIKLYRGSTLVGMNKITLQRVVPGETRHVELDWFERIPSVSKTEIIPIVNFLDPASYLPTQQF